MGPEALIEEIQNNQARIHGVIHKGAQDLVGELDYEIKQAFPGRKIRNTTEFGYGKSYIYLIYLKTSRPFDVLPVDGKDREFWQLEFYLSAVLPYYLVFISHLRASNMQIDLYEVLPSDADIFREDMALAQQFAEQRGYKRIALEYADLIVPGVAVDRIAANKATIFDCLFGNGYWAVAPGNRSRLSANISSRSGAGALSWRGYTYAGIYGAIAVLTICGALTCTGSLFNFCDAPMLLVSLPWIFLADKLFPNVSYELNIWVLLSIILNAAILYGIGAASDSLSSQTRRDRNPH